MPLTDEDKTWLGTQLKLEIEGSETRLRTEIGRVESRLTIKIERVETRLTTEVERLTAEIERIETGLKSEIERVETNLLTAFHNWASPMEARQRSHTALLRALDAEMEALDERVKKLEPPAA